MTKVGFAAAGFFLITACASEATSDPVQVTEDVGAEDALAARGACGRLYLPAQRKYELAVRASKAFLAKKACDSVTHPSDSSLVADVTVESIEQLMYSAVTTCTYFSTVYKNSVYAKPLRDVLAVSLNARIIDGSVNSTTFAGLETRMAGVKMYGPKPGVIHLFTITFAAGGALKSDAMDPNSGATITTPGTYVVRPGTKPQIDITFGGNTTTYDIAETAQGVDFVPVGGGDVISTNSDPCSA